MRNDRLAIDLEARCCSLIASSTGAASELFGAADGCARRAGKTRLTGTHDGQWQKETPEELIIQKKEKKRIGLSDNDSGMRRVSSARFVERGRRGGLWSGWLLEIWLLKVIQ
jgi:hypothetical protein